MRPLCCPAPAQAGPCQHSSAVAWLVPPLRPPEPTLPPSGSCRAHLRASAPTRLGTAALPHLHPGRPYVALHLHTTPPDTCWQSPTRGHPRAGGAATPSPAGARRAHLGGDPPLGQSQNWSDRFLGRPGWGHPSPQGLRTEPGLCGLQGAMTCGPTPRSCLAALFILWGWPGLHMRVRLASPAPETQAFRGAGRSLPTLASGEVGSTKLPQPLPSRACSRPLPPGAQPLVGNRGTRVSRPQGPECTGMRHFTGNRKNIPADTGLGGG